MAGWTPDAVLAHLTDRIDGQRTLTDTRIDGLRLLIDERTTSADRAVQAALTSAERAVAKAEVAAEKRFEAVNEFRRQLADQAATFVPRAEYDVQHQVLADKLDIEIARVAELIRELELRVSSRLDLLQGAAAGSAERRAEGRLNQGQFIAYAGLILVIIGLFLAYVLKR